MSLKIKFFIFFISVSVVCIFLMNHLVSRKLKEVGDTPKVFERISSSVDKKISHPVKKKYVHPLARQRDKDIIDPFKPIRKHKKSLPIKKFSRKKIYEKSSNDSVLVQ